MNRLLTILSLALTGTLGVALADPVLTVYPQPDGALKGAPGQAVKWNFQLAGDTANWTSVIGSMLLFETNPSVGTYVDIAGGIGGPFNGVLAPGATWNGQLASYHIDPFAGIGSLNSGTIYLLFETFSADPNTCGGCFVNSTWLTADVSVEVVQPQASVPEGGASVALLAAALFSIGQRRRRRCLPYQKK
jgi:hypothetical protein